MAISTPERSNRMKKAWRIGRVLEMHTTDAMLADPALADIDQSMRRAVSGQARDVSDWTWKLAVAIARRIRTLRG